MTHITPEVLTAYALGELPTDDAPAVEAHLAAHPDARAFVDEVRATAQQLTEALRAEPSPSPRDIKPPRRLRPALAMAAMLVLGVILGTIAAPLLSSRHDRTAVGPVALNDEAHQSLITDIPESGDETVSDTVSEKKAIREQAVLAEYDAAMEKAKKAASSQSWSEALEYATVATHVLQLSPELSATADYNKRLDDANALSTYIIAQQPAYRKSRPETASDTVSDKPGTRAIEQAPNLQYIRAQATLADYDAAMEEAKKAANSQNWPAALEYANRAKNLLDRNQQQFASADYNQRRKETEAFSAGILDRQRSYHESQRELIARDQARASDKSARAAVNAREAKVNELLLLARELQNEKKYDEAIDTANQALWLDPNNAPAQMMKEMCEDAMVLVEGRQLARDRNLYRARLRSEDAMADARYSELIRYPADWPLLIAGDSYSTFDPTVNRTGQAYTFAARVIDPTDAQMFSWRQQQEFGLDFRQWQAEPHNRDAYDRIEDNPFLAALDNPLSTFSVDVDTASYANVRRYLSEGALPPPDAVRVEEMVNYFAYDYDPPSADAPHPFAAHVQVAACPWNPRSKLVRIGLKGKVVGEDRPDANLVFLIDVSGSMNKPDKLPLVKNAMKRLTSELRDTDRVAIVVYAGASGLVLDATPGSERHTILDALDRLEAGGSTNGGAGIELAYKTAAEHFLDDGVNRVILCTDGDFNVGVTDRGQLTRLIEEKATTGVYLSVLGFGRGNLQDATMEELSNKGDGNYAYCDSLREAQRVLIEQMEGTLVAIAKDVKLQVEFNPARVAAYRLIGYENRVLAREDFNNDEVDAGDIGSGHTVTALYEVVPVTTPTEPQPLDDMDHAAIRLEEQIATFQKLLDEEPEPGEREQVMRDHLQRLVAELREAKAERDKLIGINREPATAPEKPVDDLKYLKPAALTDAATSGGELLTLKLRYKAPDAPKEQGTSTLVEFPVKDADMPFATASNDTRFAASVAAFGMLLRGSPYAGTATLDDIAAWATAAIGDDKRGDRAEFITLVHKTKDLAAPDRAAPAEQADDFETP